MQDIKARVALVAGVTYGTLDFRQQYKEVVAEDGTKSEVEEPWVSMWDNDSRLRITMHQDIMEILKKDRNFNGLAMKDMETVTPTDTTKPTYRRFVIITPRDIALSI